MTINVSPSAKKGIWSNTFLTSCSQESLRLQINEGVGTANWQESSDGINYYPFTGTSFSDGTANVSYANPYTFNDQRFLRVQYTSACDTVYSDVAQLTIRPETKAGELSSVYTCAGDSATLFIDNYTGDYLYWQKLVSNEWEQVQAQTNSGLKVPVTGAVSYRVVVESMLCGSDISNVLNIASNKPTLTAVNDAVIYEPAKRKSTLSPIYPLINDVLVGNYELKIIRVTPSSGKAIN